MTDWLSREAVLLAKLESSREFRRKMERRLEEQRRLLREAADVIERGFRDTGTPDFVARLRETSTWHV